MQQLMVSCDWGTSSLRLRLVRTADAATMAELATGDGIAHIYQQWKIANSQHSIKRTSFYLGFLYTQITNLLAPVASLSQVEAVVVSGMASSSIGFITIPYTPLPFALDGKNMGVQIMPPSEEFPLTCYIISGVSSGKDVMRGEETQLVGMAAVLEQANEDDLYCLLPGTHSKHVRIKSGYIHDFNTYMTGELYALLERHSVLAECVDHSGSYDICKDSFDKGVAVSQESDLLNSLFSVRVNYLFDRLMKRQNASYLSGLLIGAELRNLKEHGSRIVLACGQPLFDLYSRGLQHLGLGDQATMINPREFEQFSLKGHLKILDNLN
jgi:2-dehydro-3-deoxygalactonokinase